MDEKIEHYTNVKILSISPKFCASVMTTVNITNTSTFISGILINFKMN